MAENKFEKGFQPEAYSWNKDENQNELDKSNLEKLDKMGEELFGDTEALKKAIEEAGGEEALEKRKSQLESTKFEDKRRRLTYALTSILCIADGAFTEYLYDKVDIYNHLGGVTLEDIQRNQEVVAAIPLLALATGIGMAIEAWKKYKRVKEGKKLGIDY